MKKMTIILFGTLLMSMSAAAQTTNTKTGSLDSLLSYVKSDDMKRLSKEKASELAYALSMPIAQTSNCAELVEGQKNGYDAQREILLKSGPLMVSFKTYVNKKAQQPLYIVVRDGSVVNETIEITTSEDFKTIKNITYKYYSEDTEYQGELLNPIKARNMTLKEEYVCQPF